MSTHQLDARNLLCPMPVIRTQDKVNQLEAGDRLEILCTDPGTLHDIPTWCRIHGHHFISSEESDGEITLVVEVGKDAI